jgi:predicted XRE-type DNA-binding protein
VSQNVFLDTGFSEEDATVYALEADSAAAIAAFIRSRFTGNQAAAAKQLGLHQSEVSALLAGNLSRFSLSKLIRIARRAGVRLYLDMGDNAHGASATTLRPTLVEVPVNEVEADLSVELAPVRVQPTPAGKKIVTKTAEAKRH